MAAKKSAPKEAGTKRAAKKTAKALDPIDAIMAQLEKYEAGTPPRSVKDLGCSCLGGEHKHGDEEE